MELVHIFWMCGTALAMFFAVVFVTTWGEETDCAIIAGYIQENCRYKNEDVWYTDKSCVESKLDYFKAIGHCSSRNLLLIRASRFDDVTKKKGSSAGADAECGG